MSNEIDNMIEESRNGKRFLGIVFITGGILLMMQKTGTDIPSWVFSWPMILIVAGFYIGFKHRFKNHSWWIVTLIGGLFLTDHFFPEISLGQFIWPLAFIAFGLLLFFSRKDKAWKEKKWQRYRNMHGFGAEESMRNAEDYIDAVAVFGGVQKKLNTKNFQGGDVVCIFSGAEINLLQTDFNGQVTLELVNVMGGTNLIIPAEWQLVSEAVTIFGGIEDRRPQPLQPVETSKKLILRGTCVFGGIEIKSY